jgi:hypothetical protein
LRSQAFVGAALLCLGTSCALDEERSNDAAFGEPAELRAQQIASASLGAREVLVSAASNPEISNERESAASPAGCDAGLTPETLPIAWIEVPNESSEREFSAGERVRFAVRNQSQSEAVADFWLRGRAAHARLEKALPSQKIGAGATLEFAVDWDELDIDAKNMRASGELHIEAEIREPQHGQLRRASSAGLWFHPMPANQKRIEIGSNFRGPMGTLAQGRGTRNGLPVRGRLGV